MVDMAVKYNTITQIGAHIKSQTSAAKVDLTSEEVTDIALRITALTLIIGTDRESVYDQTSRTANASYDRNGHLK